MSYFGQTKGTEIEKQIAQLASGEAIGGAMYYALAKIAKEKFGLDDVAREFIELGNQETNHGAFYAMLNGRYPSDKKNFWDMVRGLSKAEYKENDCYYMFQGDVTYCDAALYADELSVVFEDKEKARETLSRVRKFIKNNNTIYCSTHCPEGYLNIEQHKIMQL